MSGGSGTIPSIVVQTLPSEEWRHWPNVKRGRTVWGLLERQYRDLKCAYAETLSRDWGGGSELEWRAESGGKGGLVQNSEVTAPLSPFCQLRIIHHCRPMQSMTTPLCLRISSCRLGYVWVLRLRYSTRLGYRMYVPDPCCPIMNCSATWTPCPDKLQITVIGSSDN